MALVEGNQLVMDPAKIAAFIRSKDGPFLRNQIKLGYAAKLAAQRLAPVHQLNPLELQVGRDRHPGTLRDSIVTRIVETADGPDVQVGSQSPIAYYVHEGTPPHTITARTKPMLVFWSGKAGKVVHARSVNHPGTKANPFLMNAVIEVLRHM